MARVHVCTTPSAGGCCAQAHHQSGGLDLPQVPSSTTACTASILGNTDGTCSGPMHAALAASAACFVSFCVRGRRSSEVGCLRPEHRHIAVRMRRCAPDQCAIMARDMDSSSAIMCLYKGRVDMRGCMTRSASAFGAHWSSGVIGTGCMAARSSECSGEGICACAKDRRVCVRGLTGTLRAVFSKIFFL